MSKLHHYNAQIIWTGNNGSGTSSYADYERSHVVKIENKNLLECSSDAAFRGDTNLHNPEDLFLSSIASCHMLWYLHLCADNGIIVKSYTDNAYGVMQTFPDGSGNFSEIILNPVVEITEAKSVELATELHYKAHKKCFLANSVNFEIFIEPIVKI